MFGENKNLKDSIKDTSSMPAPYQTVARLPDGQGFGSGSYTKTNKLITALYMVTDIIDKDEPLRNKLRTLGIEIISDITSPTRVTLVGILVKISEVMSFLDIASAINIISEMNCSILKKEFLELNQSIEESNNKVKTINGQINLSEFFGEEFPPLLDKEGNEGRFLKNSPHLFKPEGLSEPERPNPLLIKERGNSNSKGHYSNGHQYSTRIGVQKGSTLLKALSDKINTETRPQELRSSYAQNFDILKKQRRNDIIIIIKTIGGNATIKDIKDRVKSLPAEAKALVFCSEKTLQRELVSMVKDSVLNKAGEKRWSRYFLK